MIRYALIAVAASLATTASASAMDEELSRVEAPVLALIEQNPRVVDIRDILVEDCREQHPDMSADSQEDFCRCGSAVTIRMWVQSEQMVALLNDYLNAPGDEELESFLNYQGPELYAGYCSEILGS